MDRGTSRVYKANAMGVLSPPRLSLEHSCIWRARRPGHKAPEAQMQTP